jgi:hypothetical protein
MARKRYKPEEIVAKLRQVDVLVCFIAAGRRCFFTAFAGLAGRRFFIASALAPILLGFALYGRPGHFQLRDQTSWKRSA